MWVNNEPVDHGIYRRLSPNDRVRFVLSGGGGYDLPQLRAPARVLFDVKEGYVSVERAKLDYGVVIDAELMEVDIEATELVRRNML